MDFQDIMGSEISQTSLEIFFIEDTVSKILKKYTTWLIIQRLFFFAFAT